MKIILASEARQVAGAAAFPRHELYIAAALILLIAAGLHFFAGAWGVVLLWGLGLFFVLPQIGAALVLFGGGGEELAKGRRLVATGYYFGGLLWVVAWAAGVGYCGYSLYQAIP